MCCYLHTHTLMPALIFTTFNVNTVTGIPLKIFHRSSVGHAFLINRNDQRVSLYGKSEINFRLCFFLPQKWIA